MPTPSPIRYFKKPNATPRQGYVMYCDGRGAREYEYFGAWVFIEMVGKVTAEQVGDGYDEISEREALAIAAQVKEELKGARV